MKKYFVLYRRSDGKEGSRTVKARSRSEATARVKNRVGRSFHSSIYVKEVKNG